MNEATLLQCRYAVDHAQSETVTHVAGNSLFESEIRIILRRGRLEHRRTEIRSIAKILRKRVVGKERPTAAKSSAQIDVTSLIPTLRGILEQVDAAHRKRCVGDRDIGRQDHSRQEAQGLERPAWSNRTWTGRRIVDQVRALQVQSMRTEVAEFKGCFGAKTLLYRCAPLLDILWRRIGFKSGETDRRRSQYRRAKIEMTGHDPCCGNEIVALLRFRKHIRHILTLVEPRVHINRCEKD